MTAPGEEIDQIFRREVKSLPAYEKAQAASGSGIAPPVDEMNQMLMGLAIATQLRFICSPAASRTGRMSNNWPVGAVHHKVHG